MAERFMYYFVWTSSFTFYLGHCTSLCPSWTKNKNASVQLRTGHHINGSKQLYIDANMDMDLDSATCSLLNYDRTVKQVKVYTYYDHSSRNIEFTINGKKGSNKKRYKVKGGETKVVLKKKTNDAASMCIGFYIHPPGTLVLECPKPTMQINGRSFNSDIECSRHCKSPESPNHGKLLVTVYDNGCSDVTFLCDDGYERIGASTFTCLINKRWSGGNFPICTRNVTEKPSDVKPQPITLTMGPLVGVSVAGSFVAGCLITVAVIWLCRRRTRTNAQPTTCSVGEYYNYITPVYHSASQTIHCHTNTSNANTTGSPHASQDEHRASSHHYDTVDQAETHFIVNSSNNFYSYCVGRMGTRQEKGDLVKD